MIRRALAAAIVMVAAASGALAAQGIDALATIAPGEWRLHEIGTRGAPLSVCVRDPKLLFQVHHRTAACGRFTVADGPRTATIHYSCRGEGQGRTTITVENPSLLRVQTQGLVRGAPFDADYEARRVGAC